LAKAWDEKEMKKYIIIGTLLAFSAFAQAALLEGQSLLEVRLAQALDDVQPGSVVILGELHGTGAIPPLQMQVLETLKKRHKVSVGMEFFEYPHQGQVTEFLSGNVPENDFLKSIGWGGLPFDAYREQVIFPRRAGGVTLALNAPRNLTNKVARFGLQALDDKERAQLPPDFVLGNDRYFSRFQNAMGEHVPAEALPRYFAAQSIWDETMAWKASEFIKQNPQQVLVIIVGEFHVQYGGGLPDRLKARGIPFVRTFSFVNLNGLSQQEMQRELFPSPLDGKRADFLWTTDFVVVTPASLVSK
jgi:uncharacterized iron-regulated protein